MTEFTRDIQQLQKTASQQPTFAPPSQSLGQDVVNLIGTGLDFYAKNTAQSALEARAKQAIEREKRIASGILSYKGLREEARQQLSEPAFLSKRESMRKGYSDTEWMEILSATNTVTKDTDKNVLTDIDKARVEEEQRVEAINLEGSAFAGQVLNRTAAEVANAPPEQMQEWANKSKVMQRQIEIQKQIIEVSDDVTAPVIEIARTIAFEQSSSKLNNIRDLQRAGDIEGYNTAVKQYRTDIMQMVSDAPNQIRNLMPVGKKQFYDGKLVSVYTKELSGMLENPTVKDVLSGKEVNESMIQGAEIIINSRLSPYFLQLSNKVANGNVTPQVIDDFKNMTEYFTNKNVAGVSMAGTMENTIKRAMGLKGGTTPPPPDSSTPQALREQETNQSQSNIEMLFEFANDTASFIKNLGKPEIEVLNNQNKDYILDKIDKGNDLSDSDIEWIETTLTFGNTGDINKKGKGASKAVLQAPLAVLAHKDYSKIKPAIDRATAKGVDVVGALTTSLDSHIRNNVKNAFTDIMGVATSGMMGGPKTGISRAGERGPQALGSYNLRDEVNLHNDNGTLTFKYKAGTLGQSTDAVKITNLRRLNSSLVVLNDYVKALNNVTGTESVLVADEVRGLLSKYANVPILEDRPNEK